MKRAVYIHIPFCTNICKYCDFNKFYIKNQPVDDYVDSLELEMQLRGPVEAKSVFIGGGTPSALSVEQLRKLLEIIKENVVIGKVEFTVEANPDDLTREKMELLLEYGVNRLSLGVQTFNDKLLQEIGRTHSAASAIETISLAKEVGFTNISIDMIYGLPGQTLDDVKNDMAKAIELDLQHISAYSLIVEPKTVFYIEDEKGNLDLPTEDLEAEMYEYIMDTLAGNDFKQYEISNYAKKGFDSKHNVTYWNNEEYYGFGAGAHGYVDGVRYANHAVMKKYLSALADRELPLLSAREVTVQEQMEEEMFLGLRKNAGVSFMKFNRKFGIHMGEVFPMIASNLIDMELVEVVAGSVRLTRNGRLIANEVFQAFLPDEE